MKTPNRNTNTKTKTKKRVPVIVTKAGSSLVMYGYVDDGPTQADVVRMYDARHVYSWGSLTSGHDRGLSAVATIGPATDATIGPVVAILDLVGPAVVMRASPEAEARMAAQGWGKPR